MNGYCRPKHFGRLRELEPLKFCDIEFVTEDGFTENQTYLGHGWTRIAVIAIGEEATLPALFCVSCARLRTRSDCSARRPFPTFFH
jgi:hypothetical protein